MKTPHEKAIALEAIAQAKFDEWTNKEKPTPPQELAYIEAEHDQVMDAYKVLDDEGDPSMWVTITAGGWVSIECNAAGDGASGPPAEFEKICKWYLGIE